MEDAAQLALVKKAFMSGLSNCIEWINDKTAHRVRNDRELQGLTPEGIKQEVIAFIKNGGDIQQREEKRPEYSGESILGDDDPDVPTVYLVNAHPQRS
jgi:hypothetical protein